MKKLIAIAVALVCSSNGQGRAADKVDFAKQIQPILRQNCVKCHGPEKQKGKLRLDSKEAAMKGGKDGAVIVVGDADKSEFYRRITLPKGDDDIMPNEGDPLSKEQTDLVRAWIKQGADWSIAPLQDLTSLTELNLAGTKITDAGFAALADLTNLTRLHLELTTVTDAGLAHLKKLANLNYLNLYGTAVTDAGLENLKGLRNLRHLYVWQTKVTEAGATNLKAALTNLEISTGAELNVVAKKEEEKTDEKKEDKK